MQHAGLERLYELAFRGVDYLVMLSAKADSLFLEFEERHSGIIYDGEFRAELIEDITSKAKNHKPFPLFVKMLVQALTRQREDVTSVDFLSYSQISAMEGVKDREPSKSLKTKRFLILFYKTHFQQQFKFPLALNRRDSPSVERLRATVARMGGELEELRKGGARDSESIQLRREVAMLRAKLEQGSPQHAKKQAEEISALTAQKLGLARQLSDAQTKLSESQRERAELQQKIGNLRQHEQSSIATLSEEYEKVRGIEQQMRSLVAELSQAREKEKKQTARIKQLERELQAALAKSRPYEKKGAPVPEREHSVKSVSSRASKDSNHSKKSNCSHKSARRRSVMDSDTESSRQRKNGTNNYSPFRVSERVVSKGRKRLASRETPRRRLKENERANEEEERKEGETLNRTANMNKPKTVEELKGREQGRLKSIALMIEKLRK